MTKNSYIDFISGIALKGKFRWLVTGAAGFIGSHLGEALLSAGQDVVGLDNLSTGSERNIETAKIQSGQDADFRFLQGDIRDWDTCREACEGVDYVLHHAAFVSVPASIADSVATHAHNVDGFFNMLQASKECGVRRFVYASSSAVYGDVSESPIREEHMGMSNVLSPYAATKAINELYAGAWGKIYGLACIGLRYFNVFGPRQDPKSPYSAVIPRWLHALTHDLPVVIYGDGESTRDFCYVKNIVQANILAATTENQEAIGKVYNIACGEKTTLNELFAILKRKVALTVGRPPVYEDFRKGDIAHSTASIEQARLLLGYKPFYSLEDGLTEMCENRSVRR